MCALKTEFGLGKLNELLLTLVCDDYPEYAKLKSSDSVNGCNYWYDFRLCDFFWGNGLVGLCCDASGGECW